MPLSQRDRRLVIILGAVATVLIVYLAFTFLTGGGSQTLGTGPPVGPPATSPTPSVTPSPEVTPPVNIVGGRDPFSIPPALCQGTAPSASPISSASPGATPSPAATTPGAAAPGCTPSATTPSPPPTSPGATPPTGGGGNNNGGGGGGSNGGGGTPGSTTNVGGNSVSLLDVFSRSGKDVAQVRVNSSVYTVTEGERFHQNYELVSIAGRCGGFLYGDSSFTLCATSHK